MRKAGIIYLLIGIMSIISFSIGSVNDPITHKALKTNAALNNGHWGPIFFSGIVALVGFYIVLKSKNT